MTSLKPDSTKIIIGKKHKKERTRDEAFPITSDSEYSTEKQTDLMLNLVLAHDRERIKKNKTSLDKPQGNDEGEYDESESDDEKFLEETKFEDSCDHHIQYLKNLAEVAQESFDKYTDDRNKFKVCIDEYRKLIIERRHLIDTLNDLKAEIAVLAKKISTSKKFKKQSGKKMRYAKSIMTGYFMKVSDHKKANAKTLLKTQKKLTKGKSVRKLIVSDH